MEEKNRKLQFIVAFAVSLAAVTTNVSFSWTIPVIPKFHNNETNLHITDNEISWVVAVASPGVISGSLATGVISDKFGRRFTLLASAFPFAVGSMFVICALNAWMLYIARYFWGIGAGMVGTVSTIYLTEISDKDIRGTLTAGNRLMFNFGGLLVVTIGSFVSFKTLSYLLIVLPLTYFVACWYIPETPYFLLKEGRLTTARKTLLKLSGCKDNRVRLTTSADFWRVTINCQDLFLLSAFFGSIQVVIDTVYLTMCYSSKEFEDRLSLMSSDVKMDMNRSGSLKELLFRKQYRRAIIISIGLRITQVMSGSIPIMQYFGRIMQESKSGINIPTALIIFGAVRFVVGLIFSIIVDRIGRRPLLIFSFLGASICLFLVGTYFFSQEVIGIKDESSSPYRYNSFIGIVIFSIISTSGFDTLIFVVPAEIFPLNVKSVAMTSLNIFGALITFGVIKEYQLIKEFFGLCGVFWAFGAISFMGAVFSYYIVPETKGRSLREIQIELQGNIYDGDQGIKSNEGTEFVELNKK